ncbi:MAG: hypothetical protein JW798_07665 [Prolixibacteraceae bacterium]|nr:hypothetical protein [Prolixibacteraceae bacterium]
MVEKKKYPIAGWQKKLPEFEPETSLWERIESELNFNSNMEKSIKQLPDYEPGEQIWTNISEHITGTYKRKFKQADFIRFTAIAASVAILISLPFLIKRNPASSEIIVEKETKVFEQRIKTGNQPPGEDTVLKMVEQLCSANHPVCSSPVLNEKICLYHELKTEKNKLENAIETIGQSPEMMKALIKIENMKSRTVREIITLINS